MNAQSECPDNDLFVKLSKILKIYSIRKDEFQPVGESEYSFQSQIIKGYTIKILQETIEATDYFRKTGQIIVSHTQSDGKKTHVNVWKRDQGGDLQFHLRNLWNQPLSDDDYIKEIDEKYRKLLLVGKDLLDQLETAKIERNRDCLSLDCKIEALRAENEKLRQSLSSYTKHNARGAGRKPSKERSNVISQVKSLLEAGCSDQDIMDDLGISWATFYRYKKTLMQQLNKIDIPFFKHPVYQMSHFLVNGISLCLRLYSCPRNKIICF